MFDEIKRQNILERMQQIPAFSTLKIHIDSLDVGFCQATMPRDERYDGVFKSFHGGLLMTLADSIACLSIFTLIDVQEVITTTDMNIRFLSPCLTAATAIAKVIKLGRTMCPVNVNITDAASKLIGIAQVNYMRLPKIPNRL